MQALKKLNAGKLAVKKISRREEAALDKGGIRVASALYDFSSDGGAVGSITFGRLLPAGAVVTRVFADELTNVTSGGSATIQLKAGSTNLTGATAIASFSGLTAPALDGSAAAIKLSADSELQIAIATAALTAGKVRFFVEYILAND